MSANKAANLRFAALLALIFFPISKPRLNGIAALAAAVLLSPDR